MRIETLFEHDIFRPINGVVKADQLDDASVWQELDEFVVTQELDGHLSRFFSGYCESLDDHRSEMAGRIGVWISGFFGSGKSHFLKVLSYLLANRSHSYQGQEQRAVDFFEAKITDALLFGEVKRAVAADTDVILFNIDSKADAGAGRDAILGVFLKVLNEMQGFSGDHPHLAHMERYLLAKGKLVSFHDVFRSSSGSEWLDERDAYAFHRDHVVTALAETLGQSPESCLGYGYDGTDNLTQLTITLGSTVLTMAFSYDAGNRLETVTDPRGGVYRYTYDAAGMPRTLGFPNGVVTEYGYDARDRLTAMATHGSDGAVLDSYTLTLDLAGHRTRIAEADGTTLDYRFDDVFRLTEETATDDAGTVLYRRDFSYDAAGNRTRQTVAGDSGTETVTYSYDDRDRLLSGSAAFTWDAEGNLLSRTGARAADFTWDAENRLRRVTLSGGTRVDHAYDAGGNRVRSETLSPDDTTQVRDLLVDPRTALSQVVAVTDGGGELVEYYVRGLGLLAVVRPSETRYMHADGSGSTRMLTDESGVVTDRYRFSAFGELLEHTGDDPQLYLYTGERLEPESGLYDLRARWMDPEVGRFMSRDPFPVNTWQPASIHRYVYANNNPVDLSDPTGLFFIEILLKLLGLGKLKNPDEMKDSRGLLPFDVRVRPIKVEKSGWTRAAIEGQLVFAKRVFARQSGLRLYPEDVETTGISPEFGFHEAIEYIEEVDGLADPRGRIPVIYAKMVRPDTNVFKETFLGGLGLSPPDEDAQGAIVFRFKKWPDDPARPIPLSVTAHELAHALSVRGHFPDVKNLLCGGIGGDTTVHVSPCRGRNGTLLTNGQVRRMRLGARGFFLE